MSTLADVAIRATEIDHNGETRVRVDVTDTPDFPTQGSWAIADDLATATVDALKLYGLTSLPLVRNKMVRAPFEATTQEGIERLIREAIANDEYLRIDYLSMRGEYSSDRRIEPIRIGPANGSLFSDAPDRLYARDLEQEALRTFILSRIERAVIDR
jgi:hypothetical protein